MKHLFSLLLFVSLGIIGWGQSLSVASFNELPNDLDARVNHSRLDPQTGKKYAIIKVVTTQKGFVFDIGQLAMGGTEVHSDLSEIWVYVPEGTKKIKITHPQLGQLKTESNDGYYWLPVITKSAYCYRLELISGTVTTTVEAPVQQTGWLILKSTPDEADVYLTLNGEESLLGKTPFQKKLAYGSYGFRLRKSLFHDEVGMAHIDRDRVEYTANLSPAHGRLSITSNPTGARVEIEGLRETYTTPCTTDVLASGTYVLRLSKEKYSVSQKTVVVRDGQVTPVNVSLNANFARIEISSLSQAEIYLNGTKVGTGSYRGELAPGVYDIEARLASHKTVMRQLEVEANKPQALTLNPTPIYGSLDVISTPMDADITIKGKSYGRTPATINNLLIGQYQVVLSKDGYGAETATVTIEEGKTAELNRKLNNGRELTFTTTPSGADLYVDGKLMGTTPATLTLTYGNHNIKVKNGEAEVTDNISVSSTMSKTRYSYELNANEQTFTVNGVSFKMVKVEGGTFTMGATNEQGSDADRDEKSTHKVTLSTYSIGQTEVTQALWKAVMGNNPSDFKGDDLPVENVSWDECLEFIRKLNQFTGKRFRLPTEAEWEYAVRGGNKSRGYKYAGSNAIDEVAWYGSNSGSRTHTVATKQANELGLYDMSGNVWEWCQDRYGNYSSSSQTNPKGSDFGSNRVCRGGSWNNSARRCRSSYRSYSDPSYRNGSIGLRLALSDIDKTATSQSYPKGPQVDEQVGEEESDRDDSEVFVFMDEPPSFPGGEEAMYRYLSENIRYPEEASNANVSGKVIVKFVTEKDGSITNVKVLRDIGCGCGAEARRVVENMPRWKPGRQRGQAVRCEFNLPIAFNLH